MNFKYCAQIFIIFVLYYSKNITAKEINTDEFSEKFSTLFRDYFSTNIESAELQNIRKFLLEDKDPFDLEGFPAKTNSRPCLLCYSIASTILDFYNNVKFENQELSESFLQKLCIYGDIAVKDVCPQEVKNYFPFIKYILDNANISVEATCDRLLQSSYCFKRPSSYDSLDIEAPVLLGSKKYGQNSGELLRVLHFTDFHYDPHYTVGSSTNCGNWICCRGPKALNESEAAGKWGGSHCDSPDYVIRNIVEDAAKKFHNIDFIYVTGDYVDHFDWTSSREECLNSIEFVFNTIKEFFPNTQVLPILGNHDVFPANLFSPSSITDETLSSSWLYKNVSDIWKNWLPEDALVSFRLKGYYTMKLRPNFRIIALNSNVCFNGNIWLLYDNFYYRDQLEWLRNVLEEASNNEEKVHILSHVASNDQSCYRSWTKEFKKIVERYAHVISGQFNGHSHLDEFVIFYAKQNSSVALNVAWNGGAGTTFPNVNHNYKVYYVDDQSYDIVDFETWTFNLNLANKYPDEPLQWFKEYSFKSQFNVPDLSPNSIDKLVKQMTENNDLLEIYRRIRVKQAERAVHTNCDNVCRQRIISDITRTEFNDDV